MVGTTPTQALRYPQTSDPPCDADLHIRWLVDDIESKLAPHDETLEFTGMPPSLILVRSSTYEFPASGLTLTTNETPFEFDAVESQTGGSFGALETNPGYWHVPRTGIYQVGFQATWPQNAGTPTATNRFDFQLRQLTNPFFSSAGAATHVIAGVQARAFATGDGMTVSGLIEATDTADFFFWTLDDNQLLTSVTFTSARMYAFWVADL